MSRAEPSLARHLGSVGRGFGAWPAWASGSGWLPHSKGTWGRRPWGFPPPSGKLPPKWATAVLVAKAPCSPRVRLGSRRCPALALGSGAGSADGHGIRSELGAQPVWPGLWLLLARPPWRRPQSRNQLGEGVGWSLADAVTRGQDQSLLHRFLTARQNGSAAAQRLVRALCRPEAGVGRGTRTSVAQAATSLGGITQGSLFWNNSEGYVHMLTHRWERFSPLQAGHLEQ